MVPKVFEPLKFDCIKKFNEHGTVENRPGRGRRKLFTDIDVNQLSRAVKLNRVRSLTDLTSMINEGKDHRFCKKTISRKLKRLGYKRRIIKKQMVVKDGNRKKRMAWCRARRNWTVDENWKDWIFSDESQVVIGTDNRVYVWRKDEEVNKTHLVCPAPRRRVSIMIWGCVCFAGVGTLAYVEGNINAQKYITILDTNIWPVIARYFGNRDYSFMDDNAPVHRANAVFKQNNKINGIEWPAQSPDLNIIENIWLHVKRGIEKTTLDMQTPEQLFDVINTAWQNVSVDYVQRLYETIPGKIHEVLRMKGHLTKY